MELHSFFSGIEFYAQLSLFLGTSFMLTIGFTLPHAKICHSYIKDNCNSIIKNILFHFENKSNPDSNAFFGNYVVLWRQQQA